MRIVDDTAALRQALNAAPGGWALVPTMGNLHDGHLALVQRARQLQLPVAASVFVNPLQFGPGEDFARYPRTLQRDAELLQQAGCDLLFAPSVDALYPTPQTFRVQPDPALAGVLDGQTRPGHFEGVCTVVMKLLQLVQPRAAVFGKKDYQQLLVIRGMVAQFALPVDIIGLDTVRDADGLALSSRNGYLDPAQRAQAPQLAAALRDVATVAAGLDDPLALTPLEHDAARRLLQQGWAGVDYISVRRRVDLQPPQRDDLAQANRLVVLGAAKLGATRLIDNLEF